MKDMKNISIITLILAAVFTLHVSSVFAKENPRARGKAKQERFQKWAAENPKEAKKFHKLAKNHPEAAKWFYVEAKKDPSAASQLYKEARRNPALAKSIYENSVKQERRQYKNRRTAKVMRKHRGQTEEGRKHKMHHHKKSEHEKRSVEEKK